MPPPPTTPPPATPPPPDTPQTALVAPQGTAAPAPVEATSATPDFSHPGSGATFPLLQTVVTANFSGDKASVDQGATMTLASNGAVSIAFNNSTAATQAATFDSHADGLDYTRYGNWAAFSVSNNVSTLIGGGAFVGGYQTPTANLPAAGSASYTGTSRILWGGPGNSAVGTGEASVTANFGTGSVNGTMTNFALADETGFHDVFNDLGFTAQLAPGQNSFAGTVSVTSAPGGLFSLPMGSTGSLSGLFFGPGAQEVGGVWTLTGATGRAIGSFGAKQ